MFGASCFHPMWYCTIVVWRSRTYARNRRALEFVQVSWSWNVYVQKRVLKKTSMYLVHRETSSWNLKTSSIALILQLTHSSIILKKTNAVLVSFFKSATHLIVPLVKVPLPNSLNILQYMIKSCYIENKRSSIKLRRLRMNGRHIMGLHKLIQMCHHQRKCPHHHRHNITFWNNKSILVISSCSSFSLKGVKKAGSSIQYCIAFKWHIYNSWIHDPSVPEATKFGTPSLMILNCSYSEPFKMKSSTLLIRNL